MKTYVHKLDVSKIQYKNYLAGDFFEMKREKLLKKIIENSNKISTSSIDMFDVKKYSFSAQHYISGYVEERFVFTLTKKLKTQLLEYLLLDYNNFSELGLYSWELHKNHTLMAACCFVENIVTINNSNEFRQ